MDFLSLKFVYFFLIYQLTNIMYVNPFYSRVLKMNGLVELLRTNKSNNSEKGGLIQIKPLNPTKEKANTGKILATLKGFLAQIKGKVCHLVLKDPLH